MPAAVLTTSDLFVNDGKPDSENTGFLEPTPPDTPLEQMRTCFAGKWKGNLLLKELLPREDALEARRQRLELLPPNGLLKPGSEPVGGVFDADKDRADFPGKRWLVAAYEAGYVVICYMAIYSRMMHYEVYEH